jgi:hypothetical protein
VSASKFEPPSAESAALFEKERQYPPQPADFRARALRRARRAEIPESSLRRSVFGRSAWLAAAPILAFAAFAFASVRGFHPFASPSLAPPSLVPPESGRMNSPPARPALAAPPASAPAPTVPPAASAAILQEASSPEKPPMPLAAKPPFAKRRSPDLDTQASELRLLQRARAAVASAEFATALALIADYERRFPEGRLREESEALRVKSLTGLGRSAQARRAADGFRKQFPRSVLLRRIEETAKPSP